MRTKVMLLLVVLLALSWYQTISTMQQKPIQYKQHVEAAQAYEAKEIYEDALIQYQEAVSIEETAEINLKIAQLQLKLGNKSEFITGCEALIYAETMNEEALKELVSYYHKKGELKEIVSMLKTLKPSQAENEVLTELWNQYRGIYEELSYHYEELKPFFGSYCVAMNEGLYGLINTSGKKVLGVNYEAIGYYSQETGFVSVKKEDKWYYVNTKGNKKIVPDIDYDYLGIIYEGTAVAGKGQDYTYVNVNMQPKTQETWEAVTNLYGETAAVKKNGKWALLNSKMQTITDYIYEEIAIDEMGFCSRQGRIFAKKEDGYHLLDTTGQEVTTQVFSEVKPFAASGITAVCINGKWGFINTAGEMVIECKYEDAKPFGSGYAPVKQDGKWGYIDQNDSMIIQPTFEDASPFNSSGTAPVKDKNWFFIRLYAI